jgi:ketosteroid isomerase-like protein
MSSETNLAKLKSAYAAWHDTKGGSADQWLGLFSDEVRVKSVNDETAGLSWAGECCSRNEAVSYLTGLLEAWQMEHFTPETFVADGDQIAMFGHCAWVFKATGKRVETPVSHLWTFSDGEVVALIEIFDSAKAAAAANA